LNISSPFLTWSFQIGGSIAGLMMGVMLKHHGHNVTILEKEPSTQRTGYDAGIKIGPEVQAFLAKHDRVKRDMIITCIPNTRIDATGRPRPQRGVQEMAMTSWGLFVGVLRANFDGVTSASVPVAPEAKEGDGKAVFRSGARVVGFREEGEKVEVEFVQGGKTETLTTSMLIVADGSNSSMRSLLLPDVKREYVGYMCWRGTVREEDVDEKWNQMYSEKVTFELMKQTYLLK
jgi:2-polyprenyl-6-methoxyphenol hydroxylase-like FAD-dependent oxidoreductase